jgi:hypothetical protein
MCLVCNYFKDDTLSLRGKETTLKIHESKNTSSQKGYKNVNSLVIKEMQMKPVKFFFFN